MTNNEKHWYVMLGWILGSFVTLATIKIVEALA